MSDVVDRDLGWGTFVRVMTKVDGMEARIGVLSGTPKYPKKRGKTPVARVAAVHGLIKAFASRFDGSESERDAQHKRAYDRLLKGGNPANVMFEELAKPLRDQFRDEVEQRGLIETGRLRETVRGAVFDNGKYVAGDDPKRPRATESVGGGG